MAEIASWYGGLKTVYAVIGAVLSAMLIYKTAYKIIGLFFTRKFPSAKQKHKYAVVIAARNEEKVIGNLLDSIAKQDYPKELITVFVVADNCTDKTAEVAGSTATIFTLGFCDFKYSPTPVIVPPVPTPATNISTLPSVSHHTSGPVVFLCASGLAGFWN